MKDFYKVPRDVLSSKSNASYRAVVYGVAVWIAVFHYKEPIWVVDYSIFSQGKNRVVIQGGRDFSNCPEKKKSITRTLKLGILQVLKNLFCISEYLT